MLIWTLCFSKVRFALRINDEISAKTQNQQTVNDWLDGVEAKFTKMRNEVNCVLESQKVLVTENSGGSVLDMTEVEQEDNLTL